MRGRTQRVVAGNHVVRDHEVIVSRTDVIEKHNFTPAQHPDTARCIRPRIRALEDAPPLPPHSLQHKIHQVGSRVFDSPDGRAADRPRW